MSAARFFLVMNSASVGMFGSLLMSGDPDVTFNWFGFGTNAMAVLMLLINFPENSRGAA